MFGPFHRWCKRYDIAHHHILWVWMAFSFLFPAVALIATLGANFSSFAQAASLFVTGSSIGVFFYILLEAEESKIEESSKISQ